MTIKELCNNQEECQGCPFLDACTLLDCNSPFGYDEADDNLITKSIIETAKLLESDNKGSTLTNKEWVDLLQRNFNVSRTVAKEMLHGLMTMKQYDNFTKQFIH